MTRRHQFGLDARRQFVGAEIDNAGKLAQRDAHRSVAGIDHRIVDDIEFSGSGLQDRGATPSTLWRRILAA